MTKTFRVGVLGNQDDNELPYLRLYGVEVFDFTADQICSLLENPDAEKTVQATRPDLPAPVMTYQVMEGGRTAYPMTREKLAKSVQGLEILIAKMEAVPKIPNWTAYKWLKEIFANNLIDVKLVIARIVGATQDVVYTARMFTTWNPQQARAMKTQETLEQFMYKEKIYVITDQSKHSKKKGANKLLVSIDKVRSELSKEELKAAVTKPVKETFVAISGFMTSLGRWFTSSH